MGLGSARSYRLPLDQEGEVYTASRIQSRLPMIARSSLFVVFLMFAACQTPPEPAEAPPAEAPPAEAPSAETPSAETPSAETPATPSAPALASPSPCTQDIRVTSPLPNTTVSSPLTVTGQARGTWYWEGDFSVSISDIDHNFSIPVVARAQGDWMTTEFVPFEVTFPTFWAQSSLGYLVFQKDSPSDNPQFDCRLVIPVQF